ncbi:MAG: hypothetical protein ABIK92_02720 [Pseudomonadota bacterium]
MTFKNAEYSNYSDIVFYRRRWFWGLAILLLTPVGILIGLTGDVYCNQKGQITSLHKASRIVVCIGFLALILIKFVGPVFVKR